MSEEEELRAEWQAWFEILEFINARREAIDRKLMELQAKSELKTHFRRP